MRQRTSSWLFPTDAGLYCEPGRFHIDPRRPVERAIFTHGHGDHARPGNRTVLATPETLDVVRMRLGGGAGEELQPLPYDRAIATGGVTVMLKPAGHILGSAQIVLDYEGCRAVVSGDYKRARDPTCIGFASVACDVFVTEATFALPVFRHEPPEKEVRKLLASLQHNPDRTHLLGVYGLGKCQRMIALLREAGYDRPVYAHGALLNLCRLYERLGVRLGQVLPLPDGDKLAGEIVLCPPSELAGRWQRRLADPLTAFASGWMRVRGRARQRGIELPLIVSDHADWPELLATIEETGAEEVWVTHGREDALVHALALQGRKARALALVGFEDEDD